MSDRFVTGCTASEVESARFDQRPVEAG